MHSEQLIVPMENEYDPAEHCVQIVEPAVPACFPSGQRAHVSALQAPSEDENEPGLHRVQLDLPVVEENVPAGHRLHEE